MLLVRKYNTRFCDKYSVNFNPLISHYGVYHMTHSWKNQWVDELCYSLSTRSSVWMTIMGSLRKKLSAAKSWKKLLALRVSRVQWWMDHVATGDMICSQYQHSLNSWELTSRKWCQFTKQTTVWVRRTYRDRNHFGERLSTKTPLCYIMGETLHLWLQSVNREVLSSHVVCFLYSLWVWCKKWASVGKLPQSEEVQRFIW